MIKKIYLKVCLVCLIVTAVIPGSFFLDCPCNAHQFFDFDQSSEITILENGVNIEYRIWYGTPLVPGLAMDKDGDKKLSESELLSFLNKTNNTIHSNLSVSMNNKIKRLSFTSGTISTSGKYPSMTVDIALWYKISVHHSSNKKWTLKIKDSNFENYGPERKLVYINTDSAANNIQVHRKGNTHIFNYNSGSSGFALKSGALNNKRNRPLQSEEQNRLTAFLHSGTPGPGMLLLTFFTAFFLGAVHALSPGHGKAMVAAYLVGSNGKKKDAVILGAIVTFTHVISVLILGIIILFLSNKILPEQIYPWISIFSGVLIFLVGLFLLAKQSHSHDHSHSHNHSHHTHSHDDEDHHPHDDHFHNHNSSQDHPGHLHNPLDNDAGRIGEKTHPGSLVSLGVAGGMVPCPSAIVVLLVSVTLNKIVLGLAIILIFSLGLASVLISIGLLIVSVSDVSSRMERFAPILKIMPKISAGIILILGIFITFHAMIEAGLIYVRI